MRFYRGVHRYYCGIDLHARTMYPLSVRSHRDDPAAPLDLLHAGSIPRAVEPYREDLVVAVECIFCWYWLADLCKQNGITFILAHALYLKAIHGAKTKNDRLDSEKLMVLLRGGVIPQSYVYPPDMRPTRDLLRRRLFFTRKRAELFSHVQNTFHLNNLRCPSGSLLT